MERILFITANRVGDAVLSTGLLRHLLAARPDALFTIACGPAAAGVFERMPRRERTVIVEKRPWNRHWPGLWRAVAGVRWAATIDLRGSALTYLLRAERRAVMRSRSGPKIAQLAAVLGVTPPPLPMAWFDATDSAFVDRMVPRGPLLVLAPTANWTGKMWPAAYFVAVAQAFGGMRVAVLAGPGEVERVAADAVTGMLPGAIDLAGALTLPQAAALLSRATLFIGNDSGPMHLAAAAGAPTIGLFGPTSADYAPAGRCAVAVRAQGRAIETLPVADVIRAARALLGGAAPGGGGGPQSAFQIGGPVRG